MSDAVNVIVGAGQAGANAAIAMREAGFAGRILLVGDEPYRPYERPPLSKAALTEDPEPPPGWFYSEQRYAEGRIELRLGTAATAIDVAAQRATLADGTSLPYDRLLLATGGRARPLTLPGSERVLYLRTLDDARGLRASFVSGTRVVCIGAGVIGLETAASAHARGCHVTVLELGPSAMGRSMTAEMAGWVERLHRSAGIALHFGTSVAGITPDAVVCADGTRFPADVVVAGVGMVRNTALAEAAGLAMEGGAVVVDAFGRTSAGNVYAAGDITAFWAPLLKRRLRLESWRHAQNHGIAVGRVMAGVEEPYDDVPWFWSDQHGHNIQVAGLPEDVARTVFRGDPSLSSFSAFHLDTASRVVAATGVNAARDVRVAMMLIRGAAPVDPAALADPKVKLQALVTSR